MSLDTAEIANILEKSSQFSSITSEPAKLLAQARDVDATYSLAQASDTWTIALHTPDRWLSESIEADLMHTGDSMEELLEEELIESGLEGQINFKHYRDEEKQYVFSIELPTKYSDNSACATVIACFERTFRELGDMAGED